MSAKLTYGGDDHEDFWSKLMSDGQFDGDYMRVTWGGDCPKIAEGYGDFDPDTHELTLTNEDEEVMYEIDAASIKRIHIY